MIAPSRTQQPAARPRSNDQPRAHDARPRSAHRATPWILLAPVVAFLGAFFAWPLWETISAGAALDSWRWSTSSYVRGRLQTAFTQAILSVALTMLLALPLAWLHHRFRIPWSRGHLALHAAPFVLPVFVVVFGIQNLLGASGWLAAATGIDVLGTIGPLGTVVIAHAYYNFGFAARIIHGVLDRRPRRLQEAAATLGGSPLSVWRRLTLPVLAPSIVAVALLVFLFSFTSFGVVLFMGQGTVSTLETMIYQNLGGAFPRRDRAAVLGIIQLTINVVVLLAYLALRRRERGLERDTDLAPAKRQPATPAVHVAAMAALLLTLLPAMAVFTGSFRVDGTWSLEAWRAITQATHPDHVTGFHLLDAIMRSLSYSTATATLSITLTLLLAYGVRRLHAWPRRIAETLTALPLGTSSILIGLGYLITFGAHSLLDLRGTTIVIVLAHTLVAFPFTARVLLPALDLHEQRLDEAARVLGAKPLDIVRRIHIPLLRAPLIAAIGLAAAMSLGDFGASLLLMRTDTMSLAVWIQRHDLPFRDIMRAQATALSAILMSLAALAYLAVERIRSPRALYRATLFDRTPQAASRTHDHALDAGHRRPKD